MSPTLLDAGTQSVAGDVQRKDRARMVSFDSAAVYADARLQSIAAVRLACIEDTGGPNQARGYEEILQRMLERHGPLGALALIVALARDTGFLVGVVAGHDPAELLDRLEMDALSDGLAAGREPKPGRSEEL